MNAAKKVGRKRLIGLAAQQDYIRKGYNRNGIVKAMASVWASLKDGDDHLGTLAAHYGIIRRSATLPVGRMWFKVRASVRQRAFVRARAC